jgi:hypothetical protein
MAPGDSEVDFVRRWLATVRSSASVELRNAFVIIRPHPRNADPWRDVNFEDLRLVVHPKEGAKMPLAAHEIDVFRQCLLACDAVVGINTTAMIEAAIFRKPVFTVRDPAFEHSQRQTLHFAYLPLELGGFVTQASTLAEHVAQLGELFAGRDFSSQACDRFVEQFVRPYGAHVSATSVLCDAIERMALRNGVPPVTVRLEHRAGA